MAERKVNIWFALVLAWLVPGLGHFYAKRRLHGLFYLTAIAGLYAAGLVISQGTGVNLDMHPAYFSCQIGAGPVTFVAESLRAPEAAYLGKGISILMHQTGTVYIAVAGVLNLIAICELYRRHARPEAPGPADTMRAGAIREMMIEKQQEKA